MTTLDLDRGWDDVLAACPDDLCALAKSTGAVVRWRNVRSGSELLRLALRYAVGDLSLRATAGVTALDARDIADTSVLDRLRASPPFLSAVLSHLLADGAAPGALAPALSAVDATTVSVPGSTGADWRLHARFDVLRQRLCAVEVTDARGGERLSRLDSFARGEVVLGDRGLGNAAGVHHLHGRGAYALLRANLRQLGATTPEGGALSADELGARARRGDHETAIDVRTKGGGGGVAVRARLLVSPLPRSEARAARERTRREAKKERRTPSREALVLAGLLVLVTTVPARELPAREAIALYRARWQVELFFKRAKSLLGLDRLRAEDPDLVRAHLLAKLIAMALAERGVGALQGLSPLREAA